MPKLRTKFLCQQCGAEQSKWVGKCPDCGAWNSLEEVADLPQSPAQQRRQSMDATRVADDLVSQGEGQARIDRGVRKDLAAQDVSLEERRHADDHDFLSASQAFLDSAPLSRLYIVRKGKGLRRWKLRNSCQAPSSC